ncbi:hypothetical protein MMC21_004329 [Puttea exsequens]|nr:hypothetical protein [Puttea exsequens]
MQLLSDVPPPPHPESSLSHLRSPLQTDPSGPTRSATLPATLSPPSATRRSQYASSGNASSYQTRDRDAKRSSYEAANAYPLPLHGGPPPSRYSYSPPSAQGAPVSPYPPQTRETRRGYPVAASNARTRTPDYRQSDYSQTLPPPPAPYSSGVNGHLPYPPGRDSSNPVYDDRYYSDPHRAPGFSPAATGYRASSGYPPPPPDSGYYHYQNGYSGLQFEQEQVGSQQPRRRRGNLPRDTTDILKTWFSEHLGHPYPTEEEKQMLCGRTGLAMTQISNWFINARRRRIPELMSQAQAEKQLRENSGESNSSSDN